MIIMAWGFEIVLRLGARNAVGLVMLLDPCPGREGSYSLDTLCDLEKDLQIWTIQKKEMWVMVYLKGY